MFADGPAGEIEGRRGRKAVPNGNAFETLPGEIHLPDIDARPHRSSEPTAGRPDRLSRKRIDADHSCAIDTP